MNRTRSTLFTVFCTTLLMLVAGPALAGPAPLVPPVEGAAVPPAGPEQSSGSDPGMWAIVGYTAAGLLVVMVIALAAVTIDRHAHHHAPHPV